MCVPSQSSSALTILTVYHRPTVHVWSWQFAKTLHTIMATAFAAKSPSYAKIIELDKRIRDFPDPPCIQPQPGPVPLDSSENTTRTMQTLLVTLSKDTSKL